MLLWRSIAGWIRRAVTGAAGAAFLLTGDAVSQSYPTDWSMATMARFPWVWTCVRAVAGDLAGLPLIAVRRAPGGSRRTGQRQIVSDEPALRLLEQPSAGVTGYHLRKQLLVDYLLTGITYAWRASDIELIRLHPSCVTPRVVGISQTIVGYGVRYWDGARLHEIEVAPSAMLCVRDVSWSPGPEGALPESAIRCLHDDLTMELGAKKLAAEQAKRGRPDVMFSSEKSSLGPDKIREINERWTESVVKGRGAFTVGADLKATILSWAPREFEYSARSADVRDTVLAVFEVPPARAGLSSANYGTQKQQMRTYWESLVRRARGFDDAFSLLASPGVRIEHDFSDVESLQVSYSERLIRVQTHVSLGMTPADAYAYEGFDDAAVPDVPMAAAPGVARPVKPEEPQGDKAIGADLAAYLAEAVGRYRAIADAATDGASTRLLEAWETERLFAVLDAHLDAADARAWAADIVGSTVEAARAGLLAEHDLQTLAAFAPARASRLAERMAA